MVFTEYRDLDGDSKVEWILGQCWYRVSPNRWAEIYLGDKWEHRSPGWLEISVLWHEYCHAEAYLEDGISNNHDKVFYTKRRRKVQYWIGDLIAKMVYPFL